MIVLRMTHVYRHTDKINTLSKHENFMHGETNSYVWFVELS